MPTKALTRNLLLPELEFSRVAYSARGSAFYYCRKTSRHEVCPRCAEVSRSVYDHRRVEVKDAPVRGKTIWLLIRKRRFWCKPCGRPFTEPVSGISKGRRTTQRYRRHILWACERFSDLKSVRKAYDCSASFLYRALYEQLELQRRRCLYPWPKVIGLDEHKFGRHRGGFTEFASMVVDFKGRRVMEVVRGKTCDQMREALKHIPGRENVRYVAIDLCDPYKKFVREFFPNAVVVADKFHVLRLLNGALTRRRIDITGDKRRLPQRRLLLKNGHKLAWYERNALSRWLDEFPQLREVYQAKEILHRFYRTKGYERAAAALTAMTDRFAKSELPEIKTLRRTLMRWRHAILEYFRFRITNAMTEGFNNKAKLVKRRGYGYRSFENYRLRLLHACR